MLREAVENDPQFVRPDGGFLGKTKALRKLAHDEPVVGAIVIIVELIGVTLEGIGLIIRIGGAPTVFSAGLMREHLLQTTAIGRALVRELKNKPGSSDPDPSDPDRAAPAAAQLLPVIEEDVPLAPRDPAGTNGATPPRRGRGRPRRYPPSSAM